MALPSVAAGSTLLLCDYGAPPLEVAVESRLSSVPPHSLYSLCQRLSKDLSNTTITYKNCLRLLREIIDFQNSQWRTHTALSGVPCKIPVNLLLSFEEPCALEAIIRRLIQENAAVQFDDPIIDEITFPLVAAAVLQPPYFSFPKVHIPDTARHKEEVEQIVTRFGGSVVGLKAATHILLPPSTTKPPKYQVRPLEYSKVLRAVYVHFVGRPDSNNAWVSDSALQEFGNTIQQPPFVAKKPYSVRPEFIYGLEQYGEWLSEEDFLDSSELNQIQRTIYQPKSKKRGSEVVDDEDTAATKAKRPKLLPDDTSSNGDENLTQPGENKHRDLVSLPSAAFGVLSQPSTLDISGTNGLGAMTSSGWSLGLETAFGPQTSLVLPHHSGWFHMDKIHEIERRSLPEFFADRPVRSSNKSAEVYREYRDFMIHTYQQNPAHYLNYTSCRRSLAGDACAVLRVFDFLESVGLINYAVNPDVQGVFPSPPSAPPPSEPVRHALRLDNPLTNVTLTTTTTTTTTTSILATPGAPHGLGDGIDNPLALKDFVGSTAKPVPISIDLLEEKPANKPEPVLTSVPCSQCDKPLGLAHFEFTVDPSMKLCAPCITSLDPAALKQYRLCDNRTLALRQAEETPWSDSEILCLLDGLEKFGDDFDKVAEYVQSRDKTACVLQFLRLPIEELFWDNSSSSDRLRRELHSAGVNPIDPTSPSQLQGAQQAQNPIAQLTSFISRTIPPSVAAKAAKAAIDAYIAENPSLAQHKPLARASMDVDGDGGSPNGVSDTTPEADSTLHRNLIQTAGAAVAASVLKAILLAEKEERDARKGVQQLIDAQMKKVELKMKYFDEMERFLEEEHKQLELMRANILEERWKLEQDKRLHAKTLM